MAGKSAVLGRQSWAGLKADRTDGDEVAGRKQVAGGERLAVDRGPVGRAEVGDDGLSIVVVEAEVLSADGWGCSASEGWVMVG